MKILPYLSVVQSQNKTSVRRPAVEPPVRSGETESAELSDAAHVVSLENRRAVQEAPPKDLAAAELILEQVKQQLEQIPLKEIQSLHRLEGLVHFYSV